MASLLVKKIGVFPSYSRKTSIMWTSIMCWNPKPSKIMSQMSSHDSGFQIIRMLEQHIQGSCRIFSTSKRFRDVHLK